MRCIFFTMQNYIYIHHNKIKKTCFFNKNVSSVYYFIILDKFYKYSTKLYCVQNKKLDLSYIKRNFFKN